MHFRTEKAYVRGLAGGAFRGRRIGLWEEEKTKKLLSSESLFFLRQKCKNSRRKTGKKLRSPTEELKRENFRFCWSGTLSTRFLSNFFAPKFILAERRWGLFTGSIKVFKSWSKAWRFVNQLPVIAWTLSDLCWLI